MTIQILPTHQHEAISGGYFDRVEQHLRQASKKCHAPRSSRAALGSMYPEISREWYMRVEQQSTAQQQHWQQSKIAQIDAIADTCTAPLATNAI